jgi:hypothetical protein
MLVVLSVGLAGCGSSGSHGSSGPEVSGAITKAQYLSMLKRASARVTKVEGAAEQGLTPKAAPEHVKALLLAWANTETQLGTSFRTTHAPANAAKANALLARGEITFGRELKNAANHLPRKTVAIGPFLQRALGNAKGAALIDRALAQLKAAGYGG